MIKLATHFLNKYLSPYVKNIDESKLKLQLTSGSVALENLELVETVLDELDLPISVISGQLKRLTLKVPWHRIYTSPTIITIDGLYVVLSPKSELKYDWKKEQEQLQNEKIKQVKIFEQRAAEQKESSDAESNELKTPGTLEKLAMTVVKNLQVKINNIHIRYEDGYSCPGTILACGVMLDSLTFDSANENFEAEIVEELSERFFKLVNLCNFSLYFDVPLAPSERYSSLVSTSVDGLRNKMLADIIAMRKPMNNSHDFIIAPFSASARLKLNTRPELRDFKESRVSLDLDMDTFSVGIGQKQYHTAVEMVDAVDYIRLRYRYRKYRPHVSCKGKANVRQWWQYAFNCVVDDRRGLMYSVKKSLEFLRTAKIYRKLYFEKLTKKNVSDSLLSDLAKCEETLDAFSIVLQRRHAEMEAKRLGLLQTQTSSRGGWVWSLLGWKSSAPSPTPLTGDEMSGESFAQQLDKALSTEDRAELVRSLGLDEESQDQSKVPPEYKAFRVVVAFRSLDIKCYDSETRNVVGRFELSTIMARASIRANKGVQVTGDFKKLSLTGVNGVSFAEAPAKGFMGTEAPDSSHLLKFEFDSKTNDSGDQKLEVDGQPIGIFYHAATVNRLREFFTLPPSAKLQAVTEIAANAAQDLKERSVGLVKTILDDRPFVDIRLKLRGGYVVLPENGDMAEASQLMIADLGTLAIHAEPKRSSADLNVNFDHLDAAKSSKQGQAVLRELMASAYNRFSISVEPIQVLLCNTGDDWQAARLTSKSDLHLLPPLHIRALFGMCIINDPRLPATSVDCQMHPHNIVIDVRDSRLRSAVLLLASIPFIPRPKPQPVGEGGAATPTTPSKGRRSSSQFSDRSAPSRGIANKTGSTRQALAQLSSSTQLTPTGKRANAKLFALSFTLNQVTCQLTDSETAVLVRIVLGQLRFSMNADTYTISGGMTLHSFHFQHQKLTASPVSSPIHNLVNTAVSSVPSTSTSFSQGLASASSSAADRNLLTVRFVYADPLGPEFDTTHSRRRVQLFVRVGSVELLLHREAILDVVQIAMSLAEAASAASKDSKTLTGGDEPSSVPPPKSAMSVSKGSLHSSLLSIADDLSKRLSKSPTRAGDGALTATVTQGNKPRRKPEITHLFIDAKLDKISATLRTDAARIGSMQISGLTTKVFTKLRYTTIDSSLVELSVFSSASPSPEDTRQTLVLAGAGTEASHLGTPGNEIASVTLTVFNPKKQSAFAEVEAADIAIDAKLAQLRFYVVQTFVENIIGYGLGFGDRVVSKVKEAGSGLANQAKQGIKEIQSNAKKIRLNVAMIAPVIIVPRTPNELHSFFAIHLGQFKVSNEFSLCSQDDNELALAAARAQLAKTDEDELVEEGGGHEAALLNKISVDLTGFKLVRGWAESIESLVGDTSLDANCQLPLVGPISLQVELVQNLSAIVASLVPIALKFADFKVGVHLTSIDVSMCKGDYFMLLEVVNWISTTKFGPSDDKEQAAAVVAPPLTEATPTQTVEPSEEFYTAESQLESEKSKDMQVLFEKHRVLDVSFQMATANFSLYSGDVDFSGYVSGTHSRTSSTTEMYSMHSHDSTSADAKVAYNAASLLTTLCVNDVNASFVVLGNKNKSASVTVTQMTIDDARPASKESLLVTRLMECFNQLSVMKINPLVPQKPPRLIVVEFTDNPISQNREVKLEVSNLHACVNAKFITLLANFFIVPQKMKPAVSKTPDPAKPAASAVPQSKPRDREATTEVDSYSTRLSLKLGGPKLLLLDDPTAHKSAALSMQFDFGAEILLFEGNMAGSASLQNLAVYWGAYDHLKTGDTDFAQRILKPMSLEVVMSERETVDDLIDRVRKINVSSSDISLSVTPPAIRTITVVATELSAIGASGEVEVQSSQSIGQMTESLWKHKPLSTFKLDFLMERTEVATDALKLLEPIDEDDVTSPLPGPLTSMTMVLASFPAVTVKLSTGAKRKIVPLIKLRSSVGANASAFSNGDVDASIQFDLEVAYYNDQLYIWEPLLEPVECTVPGTPALFYPPSGISRHRRPVFNFDFSRNATEQMVSKELPGMTATQSGISAASSNDEDVPVLTMPKAVSTMELETSDILQLVVSKIGLQVLKAVGDSFSRAYSCKEVYFSDGTDIKSMYPIIMYNHTDTNFTVKPDASLVCARVVGGEQSSSAQYHHVILGPGNFAALDFSTTGHARKSVVVHEADATQPSTSVAVPTSRSNVERLLTYEEQRSYKFTIFADDYRSTRELTVNRAESVLFRVDPVGGDVTSLPHAFVTHVTASEGNMIIEFTSIAKVTNKLPEKIDILCNSMRSEPLVVLTLEPGKSGFLPLKAIYGSRGGFFVNPCIDKYGTSSNPINLSMTKKQNIMRCPQKSGGLPLLFSAWVDVEKVEAEKRAGFEVEKEDTYHIHIRPLVTIKNLLPFSITVSDVQEKDTLNTRFRTVEAGRQLPLRHSSIPDSPLSILLPSYCGSEWTADFKVGDICVTKNTFMTFRSKSDNSRLDLAFFMQAEFGAVVLSLYSPYWFVNKTGMALTYKVLDPDTVFDHSQITDLPVLVSVAGKMSTKRKIQLKVGDSEWSDKFSIDTVGSAGTVSCKFRNNISYYVGLKIVLASCKLTKIITLTPFFFIMNKCPFDVQCQEAVENAKVYSLFRSPPDQCEAFWPMEQDVSKQRMILTIKETGQSSVPFPFALQGDMLLKFDSPTHGVNVSCYVSDGAVHITFEPYADGLAPVLIVNDTQKMQLEFFQENLVSNKHQLLDHQEGVLYTWADPSLDKVLQWAPYDIARRVFVRPTFLSKVTSAVASPKPRHPATISASSSSTTITDVPAANKYFTTDVTKDGAESFQADPDTKVFWVSFIHKKQRILLFTQDPELAKSIQKGQGALEQKNLDITLKIAAVGFSLVDNLRRVELIYAAITPSAVEWQYQRKRHFKAFSSKENDMLEMAHDQYQRKKAIDPNEAAEMSRAVLDHGRLEVDFARMWIIKGDQKITLRRVCQQGIWLNCGFSDFHSQFHFKMNRIQIDNQVPDARYQTALAPVPPPKSVAADAANPKPFVEMSLLLQKQADAQMLLFKYFKVLVQEMSVQVDLPFILQLASFFTLSSSSLDEELEMFRKDIKYTQLPLEKTDLGPELSGGQKHFFDMLHISPLKLHVSFSPQTSAGNISAASAIGDVGAFLLNSVGIFSGDVTDAVFRLGYFQQNSKLLTVAQLSNSMVSHYTQQALRQFFNVLLGFDVIGNPASVVRGFASGVETLFYEPWQGAIQGPEEMAMGVAIGLQNFFGKTVGGVTGALSKVTGTIGTGISRLTFDEEHQRARKQERMQVKSVGQSLAYGGKQLVGGFFEGVTGIATKPIEGAQKEGVEGFFKGLGIGLVGVVTRPTGGVIDFAATGLDTIRRVADASEELKRLRPPRLLVKDGIIRPFLYAEAEANSILVRIEKGRFKEDGYVGHLMLSKDAKRLFVITEKGLIGISKSDVFSWDPDFVYVWNDLRDLPMLRKEGIVVPLKERQKRLGIFTGGQVSRVVTFACERQLAEEFVTRMQETKNRLS